MNIEYIKCGEYYIPNLRLPPQPEEPLTKYGRRRIAGSIYAIDANPSFQDRAKVPKTLIFRHFSGIINAINGGKTFQ